ncbi:MAG: glycerol-3-phosphate acyltransferase [Chloroflexi bacterium]|nr:glycerol-3-phosphate acyltransferase [Chloroflexota bacterium]
MLNFQKFFVASALIGYFCGAFPTGYFAGRMWGVDVRKHGSGRTGGTNVLRSAGWGAFLLTFFGDLFKGALAVLLSRAFFPDAIDAHAFTAFFVMLGHIWSVFILLLAKPDPRVIYPPGIRGTIQKFAQRGRGGAGVAPTSGAMITLFPPVALVVVLPFFIWIFARYASVGSISVAFASPFLMLYFSANGFAPWSYFLVTLLVCVVVIIVHRPNIERLRAGTEKKLGERLGQRARKPDSTPSSR